MLSNKWTKSSVLLGSLFILGACGNGETDESGEGSGQEEEQATQQTLHIGASNTPHAEILEFVQPALEEEGIELEITTYDDYIIPNEALAAGDIDANYFQHIPFFENALEENDFDFTNAGSIHLEPIGAFSQEYDSLEDLPDGAEILVSNNTPDHGRVLNMFEEAGLLTLEDEVDITTATFDDISENPHDFSFDSDYDPGLMPTLYQEGEGDVVFINSNFAVDFGIDILNEAIQIESESSPYANIIAVRSEDAESESIQRLVEELQSQETRDFITENWDGAVLPATDTE